MLRFRGQSDCHDNGATLSHDDPVRRVLALLGIAVATLGSGVPAHADPSLDASFLDSLTKAGITVRDGPGAVKAGRTACGLMQQGKPELDVIQLVTKQNPGLDTTRAAQFTAIAASAYCPQYLQRPSDNGGGDPNPTPQPSATTR
jgi:hypothetical protein